jgi:hypothetical protein
MVVRIRQSLTPCRAALIVAVSMVSCRESARPAIAVKFDNQHALGISRHLHGAIGAEGQLDGLASDTPWFASLYS